MLAAEKGKVRENLLLLKTLHQTLMKTSPRWFPLSIINDDIAGVKVKDPNKTTYIDHKFSEV